MAELADALDSGSSVRKDMQVQVLFSAPQSGKERFAKDRDPSGLRFFCHRAARTIVATFRSSLYNGRITTATKGEA